MAIELADTPAAEPLTALIALKNLYDAAVLISDTRPELAMYFRDAIADAKPFINSET